MADNRDARRWLDYAEEDWAYGQSGVDRFSRAASWSFQQAAEKALKACLIHRELVPPRTHDLVLLLNQNEVSNLVELSAAVLLLAEISTSSRYPDDAEPVDVKLAREYGAASRLVLDYAHGMMA